MARTPQTDNIRKQLSRLGDSPFEATCVEVQLSDNWFIPSSVLSDWRRQSIAALSALPAFRSGGARIRAHIPTPPRPSAAEATPSPFAPWQNAHLDYTANVSNRLAHETCLQAGAAQVSPAYELAPPPHATIMTCRHCIRYTLGACPQVTPSSPSRQQPEHPFPWSLRLADGRLFPLRFNCHDCEMHVQSSR